MKKIKFRESFGLLNFQTEGQQGLRTLEKRESGLKKFQVIFQKPLRLVELGRNLIGS